MADADSSYMHLAELNRLSNGLFDLSCEIDCLAHISTHDESSPSYHLGSLLLRVSERLAAHVADLQALGNGVSS
jgi:hypothetical protein